MSLIQAVTKRSMIPQWVFETNCGYDDGWGYGYFGSGYGIGYCSGFGQGYGDGSGYGNGYGYKEDIV